VGHPPRLKMVKDQLSLSIRVLGNALDFSEVSKFLGASATETCRAGDQTAGGRKLEKDAWILQSPLPKTEKASEHFSWLQESLSAGAERVRFLRERQQVTSVDCFLGVISEHRSTKIKIRSNAVSALGRLLVDLEISLIFVGSKRRIEGDPHRAFATRLAILSHSGNTKETFPSIGMRAIGADDNSREMQFEMPNSKIAPLHDQLRWFRDVVQRRPDLRNLIKMQTSSATLMCDYETTDGWDSLVIQHMELEFLAALGMGIDFSVSFCDRVRVIDRGGDGWPVQFFRRVPPRIFFSLHRFTPAVGCPIGCASFAQPVGERDSGSTVFCCR
jgi:hypothetical protein